MSEFIRFSGDSRPTRPLFGLAVGIILSAVVLGGGTGAPTSPEPAVVVGMTNTMTYTPDTIRVQVGETVRWENSSAVMHTVTADPDEAFKDNSVELPDGASAFDSGNLDPGETFEYTFEVAGTYRYFCVPHEAVGMHGTVIVE